MHIHFISFFWKAASLWNALPAAIKSSTSFCPLIRLESFWCGRKQNYWHLHGSNPNITCLHCRLRLGHSVLNLNKRTYRSCSCDAAKSEERLLLRCTLHSAFRVDLLLSVKVIFMRESLADLLAIQGAIMQDFHILLFGHPYLKLRPTAEMCNAVSKYLSCTNCFTSR